MHWIIILAAVFVVTSVVGVALWWRKPVTFGMTAKRASEIADENIRATEFAEFPAPQKY